MDICYVVGFRVPNSHGGSTHTCELGRALASVGHKVVVVSSSFEQKDQIVRDLAVFGIKSSWVPPLLPVRFWRPLLMLIKLARIVKKYDFNVLYVRATGALDAVGTFVGILTRRPVVLEVHAPVYTWFSMKYATKIVTFGVDRRIVPDFKSEVLEMDNGVDPELFNPAVDGSRIRAKYRLTERDHVVVYSGGFYPWHGLDSLVDAGRILCTQEGLDVRFLMVGDGPCFESVKASVRHSGLDSFFVFTGKIPYEQMPLFIAAADIAVAPFNPAKAPLTSRYGFFYSPLKLFEYMACGKPIVSVFVGNVPKIIEHKKTGLLIPPANPRVLADTIRDLVVNKKLATTLGLQARQVAVDKYSWTAVARKLSTGISNLEIHDKSRIGASIDIFKWYLLFFRDGAVGLLREMLRC